MVTTVYHLEWFRNTYGYMLLETTCLSFLTFAKTVATKDSLNIDTSLTHISHSFTWGPTSSRITSKNNHNYYTSNISSQHVSPQNSMWLYPFTVIRKANWAYIYIYSSIFFWRGPTRGAHTVAILSVTFGFLNNYVHHPYHQPTSFP